LNDTPDRLESGGSGEEAEVAVAAAERGTDAAMLKVFNAALKAGRHGRAYEVATRLHSQRSVSGKPIAPVGRKPFQCLLTLVQGGHPTAQSVVSRTIRLPPGLLLSNHAPQYTTHTL
jgi:hypothetical protein